MRLYPYFSQKAVALTGAASGIGYHLALELAASGARLWLVDRNAEGLARVAGECRAKGAIVEMCAVDLTDHATLAAAHAALPAALRDLDVVICNAGMSQVTLPLHFDRETCQRIMEVNYFGTVNMTALVLPGMIARRRGHLVATSSLAGCRGLPGSACYSASKAAQAIFLESMRVELRPVGIKVSVAFPGFVDTPMNDPLKDRHAMPFMIRPDDAARRILRGVSRRRTRIEFPWPSKIMAFFGKPMANWLYDLLLRLDPFEREQMKKTKAELKALPRAGDQAGQRRG